MLVNNRSIKLVGSNDTRVSAALKATYHRMKMRKPADHVILTQGTSDQVLKYAGLTKEDYGDPMDVFENTPCESDIGIPSDIFINKNIPSEDMLVSFLTDIKSGASPEEIAAIEKFENKYGTLCDSLPCRFMLYPDWALTVDRYIKYYDPENPTQSPPIGVIYSTESEQKYSGEYLMELVLINKGTVAIGNTGYVHSGYVVLDNKRDPLYELTAAIKKAIVPSIGCWYGILKMMNDPKYKELFMTDEKPVAKGISKIRKHVLLPEDFDDDNMNELDE